MLLGPTAESAQSISKNGGFQMQMIFSTDQVAPRERFDHWHSIACKNIVEHDTIPKNRAKFDAIIEAGSISGLQLIRFRNSPMRVFHTQRQAARSSREDLFVCYQHSGTLALSQSDREVSFGLGDFTLLDPSLPYSAVFSENPETLVLKVPRSRLEARIGSAQNALARLVSPVAFVTSVVAAMPSAVGNLPSATEQELNNLVVELIASSINGELGRDMVRLRASKALTLKRIHSAVELKLHQVDLGVEELAGSVGVSARYANNLLAQENTSLKRLITARRLARCKLALRDSSQRHRNISDIAYGWGFSDPTNFGRKFKKAFGITPGEWRAGDDVENTNA